MMNEAAGCFYEPRLSFRRSSHREEALGVIEGNRTWNDVHVLSCSFSFFLVFLVFLVSSHAGDDSHAEMIYVGGSHEEVRSIRGSNRSGGQQAETEESSERLLPDNKRGMRDRE